MGIQALNQGTLTLASQLPFYDTTNGQPRRASVAQLAEVLAQLDGSDDDITQYASPTATGFSVTASPFVAGGSVFLLIQPAADYAAGTINMPTPATNGQRVTVHCTRAVSALTVSGNGSDVTSGAPTALAEGGFFTMRYDAVTRGWYRVG